MAADIRTLLKRDLWIANTAPSSDGIRGAIGFRQVQGTSIYATGQPTEDAITNILHIIKERQPDISSVVWICLREEPLVMINGELIDNAALTLRCALLPASRRGGAA